MTIYDQIDANRRSTWFLMVLFVVFVAAVVELIALAIGGGYIAGIIVLIFAGIFVTISYYSSSSMVLGISQAREVKHDENPDLYNVVENLCIGSGMPVPKIYIINDTAPNAFATGRDPQHATIAVTSGLLQKLDKLELEGVIAHELSHIKNYDIRLMTLVVVLVGLVALLADFMLRFTFFGSGSRPSNRRRTPPSSARTSRGVASSSFRAARRARFSSSPHASRSCARSHATWCSASRAKVAVTTVAHR